MDFPLDKFLKRLSEAVFPRTDNILHKLLDELSDEDPLKARSAAKRLGDRGDIRAVPALIRELAYQTRQAKFDEEVRAIWDQGDRRGAVAMCEHLGYGIPELRSEVACALGKLGDVSAIPPLLEVLQNDEDFLVHCNAVWALGELKANQAVAPLTKTLSNSKAHEPDVVVEALLKIGTPEALEAVRLWRERHNPQADT